MKYVGIAAKSDVSRLYALREDGALFAVFWENGEARWKLVTHLPHDKPEPEEEFEP